MSEQEKQDEKGLPADVLARIDRIRDDFEKAQAAGNTPRIQDYLERIEPPDRPALEAELRALEHKGRRIPGPSAGTNDAQIALLIGLLGYQTGLISQVVLIEAMRSWAEDKSRSMREILAATGSLDGSRVRLLDGLIAEHVRLHEGDVTTSLASVPAGRSTIEELRKVGDADVNATLSYVHGTSAGTDSGRPAAGASLSYRMEEAASDGQRYRVLRPHAQGGLGSVFVALDQELHREVALKEIQDRHADDPVSRSRFLLEAEITGGLEHPGIVPVYGLGTYGNGRPYYAMRFIRGDSLKEAIEQFHADHSLEHDFGRRSLELRKLLRRFLDVCNAIDYAHSRGVLHRDLKPGNVIVGKYGETLVIDWGLAKAQGTTEAESGTEEQPLSPPSAGGTAQTVPGSAMGTPAYMSPEQARGELDRLGPRSDVYSLGATLYCLLTGKPPFEGGSVAEVIRAVQQGLFRPPRQLDSTIDRALDAICLRAMACAPEARYASCKTLADDIERWMADEPVSAWAEPVAVRLARWARRHRPQVAGAAGLLIATTVALTVGTVLLRQANNQTELRRQEAQENYQMARGAVEQYLTRISEESLLNQPHMEQLRKDLLNTARQFYQKLLEKRGDGTLARLDLAGTYLLLSRIDSELGAIPEAIAQGTTARRLFTEVLAAQPEKLDHRHRLGRSELFLGKIHRSISQTTEAIGEFERAVHLFKGLEKESPQVTAYSIDLADACNELGRCYSDTGDLDKAEDWHRRGLEIFDRVALQDPQDESHERIRATCHNNLGSIYDNRGQRARAEDEYEQARMLWDQLVTKYPNVDENRSGLAASLHNLGLVYQKTDRTAEAINSFKQAADLWRRLSRDHPDLIDYEEKLAIANQSLGLACADAHRAAEAEAALLRAVEIGQRLTTDHPQISHYRLSLSYSRNNLGYYYYSVGRLADAVIQFRSACEIEEKLAADHPDTLEFVLGLGSGYGSLAGGLLDSGDPQGALEWIARSITALDRVLAREPQHANARLYLRNAYLNRALAYSALGRHSEAVPEWERAITLDDGKRRDEFKLCRAADLAASGSYKQSLSEAEKLTGAASIAAGRRGYALACVFAAASKAVSKDTALGGEERSRLSDELVARALGSLREAHTAGFFRDPRVMAELVQQHFLDSVRSTLEFQLWTGTLPLPADPFAP